MPLIVAISLSLAGLGSCNGPLWLHIAKDHHVIIDIHQVCYID